MRGEQALLRGGNLTLAEISPLLTKVGLLTLDADIVRLEGEKLLGELYLFTVDRAGMRTRLQADTLEVAPPEPALLKQLAATLSPSASPEIAVITAADRYYYHHQQVTLPAWRVISGTPDHTRYYLDPQNGALLSKIDSEQRWYRWLFYGLHRGDFTAFMRSRPIWDLLMWTLLLGVTATCATGFCMGVRRLAARSRTPRSTAASASDNYRLSRQKH